MTLSVVGDIGVGYGALAIGLVEPVPHATVPAHAGPHYVAAVRGGAWWATSHHPPVVVPLRDWPELRVVVVTPELAWDAHAAKHALPRTIPVMKHVRQAMLSSALPLAFQAHDAGALHGCDGDAVVGPAIGPRLPGFFPAATAARGAGALLFGLANGGPTVAALSLGPHADEVGAAIVASFAAHALPAAMTISAIAPHAETR
ncbi:MAG: hypothetical protein H6700_02725 [Myxococcales bacterium]|nr:hypothetical protein [Myxococcales bacterium]MCB9519622.1 hypothetical protein [Myxococcales bacterium]MCB9530654.1 hypothetical protein [Myxococcales bacterium]